jgi:hypothetical protein
MVELCAIFVAADLNILGLSSELLAPPLNRLVN